MKRFENKVAIVTGAASGIGRETAMLFAREGASVVVSDISDLSEVISDIKASGGEATGLEGDVSSSEYLQEMIDLAVKKYRKIDILINNAGIGIFPPVPIESISMEEWDKVFAVNVRSGFLATKYALPHLRKTRGSVLFTGSIAGIEGMSNGACYSATKAAIINMARSIALDHAPEGIRVNVVNPGATKTAAMDSLGADGLKNVGNIQPLKKIAAAAEIAEAFAYLASDVAISITGQTLVVDNGYTAGDYTLIPSAFA